jgi:formate hydrogenlyase transcriptional activator
MATFQRDSQELSAGQRYQTLLAVSAAIHSHRDQASLFRALADRLRQVVRFDLLGCTLLDATSNTLRLHVLESTGPVAVPLPPFSAADDPGGLVLQSQRPLTISNVAGETRWPQFLARAKPFGFNSVCLLPLTTAHRRVGVLAFCSRRAGEYDAADLDFLQQVANQVAVAVDNALAFDQIEALRDKLHQEKVYLEEEVRTGHNFGEIVGQSAALRAALKRVEAVAPTDSTVLVLGETGTGKELIARAIHDRSPRRERTLVALNCAAISVGLLESELFGHEKGAFTGAVAQRIGRFELAHQGTLFLDEVGDLPLELQAKLLRVLQDGVFERVGGSKPLRVDVRVVAATNRDLARLVAGQKFRDDLYYRINVFPIHIPPLRERRDDIPLLARHALLRYARKLGKRVDAITEKTLEALAAYHWPGNVRELQNVIERGAILTSDAPPHVLDLDDWLPATAPTCKVALQQQGETRASSAGAEPAAPTPTLEDVERTHIVKVLESTGWRVSGSGGAARILGLKPTTLEARMKRLGITRPAR